MATQGWSWRRAAGIGVVFAGVGGAIAQTAGHSVGGRVTGAVTSLTTGKGLPGAVVRLQEQGAHLRPPDPFDSVDSTAADAEGQFTFEAVAPGTYLVYADAPGHVRAYHGARPGAPAARGIPVRVQQGGVLERVDVALPAEGVIRGRILMGGHPVRGVHVAAMMTTYSRGRRVPIPMAFTDTDEKGEYTLSGLRPARYFVRVDEFPPPRISGEEGVGSDLRTTVLPTYYPGSQEIESAVPVEVGPGREVDGIDLKVERSPLHRVQGRVDWGGLTPPDGGLILQLTPSSFDIRAAVRPKLARVAMDGTFVFEGVAEGEHIIEPARIMIDASKQRGVAGRVDVRVKAGAEQEGGEPVLRLFPAPHIEGIVRLDIESKPGAARHRAVVSQAPIRRVLPPPPPGQELMAPREVETTSESPADEERDVTGLEEAGPAGVLVRMIPVDRLAVNAPRSISGGGGGFRLEAVPAGRYEVVVEQWPTDFFVKAIEFNGADATQLTVEVAPGVEGALRIVLADGAGRIAGEARDREGKPAAGALVSVCRDEPRGPGLADTALVATADHAGSFQTGGLGPGKYRVVAWEDVDAGLAQVGAICRHFASSSEVVTVKRGEGAATINLRVVEAGLASQAELLIGLTGG